MAKQTAGILGTVTGKISNVVGATWKGTAYFRTLVTPANPNSQAQQDQRGKWTALVPLAKAILSAVIWPYWNPFHKKISGFNAFMQVNAKAQGAVFDPALLITGQGSLEPLVSVYGDYDDASGVANGNWTKDCTGNGLAADKVALIFMDTENNVAFVDTATYTRTNEAGTINIGGGRTTSKIVVSAFAFRGTGNALEVSNSGTAVCEEG